MDFEKFVLSVYHIVRRNVFVRIPWKKCLKPELEIEGVAKGCKPLAFGTVRNK